MVMLFSFGLIFELPLAIAFLTQIGVIAPSVLIKHRRIAIVSVFIVAAILTPPDAFTQILLAFPLLVLYELSIIISKIIYKKNNN
jgi:sec-independent protein translocase protein TatC